MKKIIISVIAFSLLYITFFHLLPYLNNSYKGCYIHKDVYEQEVRFKVVRKYIDEKNHGDKVLVYLSHGQEVNIELPFEEIYDYLEVGDSLIKNKNSIDYQIIFSKSGKDTTIKFISNCRDSLEKSPN